MADKLISRKRPIGSRLARRGSPFGYAIAVLVVATALLIFVPLLATVVRELFPGGRFATDAVRDAVTGRGFLDAVRNTAILIVAANAFAVPIGVLFAWMNERTDARMGVLASLLPVIPLLLPVVAVSIGWVFLADPNAGFLVHLIRSLLNVVGIDAGAGFGVKGWPGLIFLYALHDVPLVYIMTSAAFRGLDPSIEEAARMSGAGRLRCFLFVSVPAIRQSVLASVFLVSISTIGIFSIAAIVGVPSGINVLSVYIYNLLHAQYPPRIAEAVVLGLFLVIVISGLYVYQRRLATSVSQVEIGEMGVRPNLIRLGPYRWLGRGVIFLFVAATSVLPLMALLLVALQPFWTPEVVLNSLSLDNYTALLDKKETTNALRNSLVLSALVATAVVAAGCLFGVAGRGIGGWRERLIGIATKTPAAIPHIVIAVGILASLGPAPLYLNGSALILLICYFIVYLPQACVATETAAHQIGSRLTEAARVFGGTPWKCFTRIQLPLMTSGIAAGWALVFAAIVGELNAAVILSGPTNPVVGYLIMNIDENGTYSQLAALASLASLFTATIVILALVYARPTFARNN